MDPITPLWTVCETVYFPQRLTITSPATVKQYRIAVTFLSRHLGKVPTLADLTDDTLCGFVRYLQGLGLAAATVNDRVGRLRALWEWSARRGHVDRWPTVQRVREPERLPQAWSEQQLQQLFSSVAREDLDVGDIPGRLWWRAFLALVWNTAERKTATLSLRWEWLAPPYLHVPAECRKGHHKDMLYLLWDETLTSVAPLRGYGYDLIVPWPMHTQTFYNRFTRILRRAGLPCDRRHKTHCLRVSHASWCRAISGQSAPNLGHANETTTRKHYEDPRICRVEAPKLFVPWQD